MTSHTADVAIVGGGIIGSAIAYFLAAVDGSQRRIVVVEKDLAYEKSSTCLSVGGIRQQFSTPENIEMSKYGARFYKSIADYLTVDGVTPDISFIESGYLTLATAKGRATLQRNYQLQRQHNVAVRYLNPRELKNSFNWLATEAVAAGTWGVRDEGWVDPYALLMAFLKKAKALGVIYCEDEVIAIERTGNTITGVVLSGGGRINCGCLVNAAGPAAGKIARMVGIEILPVSPRKRFVYCVDCRTELQDCPLVIFPNGVYFRPEGNIFICGVSPPDDDPECSDFVVEYGLFEQVIWPTLAQYVPAFEKMKLLRAWAGHYAFNIMDQNAILGPHPEVKNFFLANGFSGHGLQQAPAVGRALSELISTGAYQSLDLSAFSFERLITGALIMERNVV